MIGPIFLDVDRREMLCMCIGHRSQFTHCYREEYSPSLVSSVVVDNRNFGLLYVTCSSTNGGKRSLAIQGNIQFKGGSIDRPQGGTIHNPRTEYSPVLSDPKRNAIIDLL